MMKGLKWLMVAGLMLVGNSVAEAWNYGGGSSMQQQPVAPAEAAKNVQNGSNVIRSFDYSRGFMVGLFDAATNAEMRFSAGQLIERALLVEGEDGADSIIVEEYTYVNGALQSSHNNSTNMTTYYGGDQSKMLKVVFTDEDGNQTVHMENVYCNQTGNLVKTINYGLIGEGESYGEIGYTTYDSHGRRNEDYSLNDPDNANSGFVKTGTYHYDGQTLTHREGLVWVQEPVVNEDGDVETDSQGNAVLGAGEWKAQTTYYDTMGRETHATDENGSLVQSFHYDGTKLMYVNEYATAGEEGDTGPRKVISTTYFDTHGRVSEKWDIEDGQKVEGSVERWYYNDTNQDVTTTYTKTNADGTSETVKVTAGAGGMIRSEKAHTREETNTVANPDGRHGTWEQTTNESWTAVTYYNYNRQTDIIQVDYQSEVASERRISDPSIVGVVQEVIVVDNQHYVVVSADQIDLYDGDGFQSADGETFYVAVDAETADIMAVGDSVLFAGDVAGDVDGNLTITMNTTYGGGYALGEDSIDSYISAREGASWYQTVLGVMSQVWSDIQRDYGNRSDWRQGFEFLKTYFGL